MLTLDDIRDMLKPLPDVVEGISWDSVSFKVNKKVLLYWNSALDCPMFKVPFEERDFLLEVDPETYFITDHHRPWPLILARPDRVSHEWVRSNLIRVWRAQVAKSTLKFYDKNHT